ncbi:hypothetical protein [Pseudoruegeria sp. SHC-113]|uniref:hypothetical protein n=1 Tax=Pseudoruegeria sp. SHC-113 TaxID=2855439 RepID=UPI0021BB3CA5|nr:hypothetical protein [Pseudoruegeria sp. SHC-113]MCT8158605.1 hypothetical protein [Pseudoruegeria sp. SHC-113]
MPDASAPVSGGASGLALAPDHLQPIGSPLRIDFGRAEAGTVAAISRLVGAQPQARIPCSNGAGAAQRWANGLTLYFLREGLHGWRLEAGRGASVATVEGFAPGQPVPAATGPYVFEGDASGLTAISAGESCPLG